MKILLVASAVILCTTAAHTTAALAQSVPEKTGVNSALGIAPKTQDFVTLAAQSDLLEIESSKLALTKSDNSKTKQFAERMIKDHTQTSTELKGLVAGGKVPASLPPTLDKAHQDKLASSPSRAAVNSPANTTPSRSLRTRTPFQCSSATARKATIPSSKPSPPSTCRISRIT